MMAIPYAPCTSYIQIEKKKICKCFFPMSQGSHLKKKVNLELP